jgi:predicted ATPase
MPCECAERIHDCRFVVLTGGPGAGKTAVLEIVRRAFCEHIAVLPESATILFGGGFPRHDTEPGRRAAQGAIFRVQRAMEEMSREERQCAVALCDRGTLDGLAYWPEGLAAAAKALHIDVDEELARYHAVIHLRTPSAGNGYDHSNPVRTESADAARALDARVLEVWARHPRRIVIDSESDFLRKVARAVAAIRDQVPACCRTHAIPELDEHRNVESCAMPSAATPRATTPSG